MKKYALKLMIVVMGMVAMACGGGDSEPTKQDKVRKLLTAGTWKIQSVTVGDLDAMELFENTQITFTKNGFTSTNGAPVWPATGSWSFGDDAATKLIRSDEVEITITTIDEETFSCDLYWDENVFGEGRTDAVEGEHSFVFKK